jgi:hypothetical protein
MISDLTGLGVRAMGPSRGRAVRGGADKVSLLVGLTSYWKMNEAAFSTRVDSMAGANNMLDVASNVAVNSLGIANLFNQSAYFTYVVGKALRAASTSAFAQGAGKSFTLSGWMYWADTSSTPVVGTWDGGATNGFLLYNNGSTQLTWNAIENISTTQRTLVVVGPTSGATFYLSLGYDTVAQQIWAQFNAGTRTTTACADVESSAKRLTIGNYSDASASCQSAFQDWGFWQRSLSTADVTRLYNAGGGLPFSQF